MYQMTILLAKQQGQLLLQFKQKAAAKEVHDRVKAAKRSSAIASAEPLRLTLTDDYSRELDIGTADIIATLICDCAEVTKGQADTKLIEIRANAQLQKTVAADPVLKLLGPMPTQMSGIA